MNGRIFFKILFSIPVRLFSRKCGFSGSTFVALTFLVIFGYYITSSHNNTVSNDKLPIPLDVLNDTGYTEVPIVVNTETSNVMIRKQQTYHIYEQPILENETVTTLHTVQVGEILPNCGLPKECGRDSFSVHLYTGTDNKDGPKLCVDGKYIIAQNVNDAGRGMNVAVVDNFTRTIVRVSHIDTYEKESSVLETLLLTLRPGDIAILLTFDEPSRRLSRIARLLLFDLGSALIQNLNYRSSWYLITQKGMSGFSPFEDLHFMENNSWPKKHDVRFCVPFELKGTVVHPDPPPFTNPSRVAFCEKHEDLPLFCDADVINDPLLPAPIWKQPAAINNIYKVPILVMSGENAQYLPTTLESLIRQPGLKLSLVVVYHLAKNSFVSHLSELFGFFSEELSETPNYCDRVSEALEMISLLYPDAEEFIFIGENAILAPDFLFYMGQLLSIFSSDQTLLSVSAYNENGFVNVSGDPSLAYRVESFSSLAALVRKDFLKKSVCRNGSIIDPLFISSEIGGVSIVPDVSRVILAAPISSVNSSEDISSYTFSFDRTVTYEQNILLKAPEKLIFEEHESELKRLVFSSAAIEFDEEALSDCLYNNQKFKTKIFEELSLFVSNATNLTSRVLSIYFFQEEENDIRSLQMLCDCIGLFNHPLHHARGLYKGVLRFMLKEHQAALVGSKSPFFRSGSTKGMPVVKFDENLAKLVNVVL